ncbi:DUF4064 domain-containing protein [Oceanobacillus kapialis]|uniref:DUF4064 domain-containing protein n=1 Tax=Oceanobacillus kapialis TaxID=481353 RepID=A0ABW5Q327_9BACI
MNRTIERVLGVVAVIMDFLVAILGTGIILLVNSGIGWFGESIDSVEWDIVSNILYIANNLLWLLVLSFVISFILGIIAIIKVKSNAKLAGGLFIASAVISSWLLFTGVAFQCILYLIAGLMCLFRKS